MEGLPALESMTGAETEKSKPIRETKVSAENAKESALEAENARLRSSVAAMRAEMENLQRAAFEHAGSTPGSTPRFLAQTIGGSVSVPPSPSFSLAQSPATRLVAGVSERGANAALELARAETRRLTRDKEKLLEMANGLRAELERAQRRLDARAVSVLTTKALSNGDLGITGSPPAFTETRVRADYVRGENVKASDRATESQRSALRKTARQTEVRRVRNWNVTADAPAEPMDTVVVHQR